MNPFLYNLIICVHVDLEIKMLSLTPRHQDIHSFFRTNTEIITNLLLTSHFKKKYYKEKIKKI